MRVKDYEDSKKRVTSAQCSFSIGYKKGREDILNKIKNYIEFAKKENIKKLIRKQQEHEHRISTDW